MRKTLIAALICLGGLTACSGAPEEPAAVPSRDPLHRPFHLPRLEPGGSCPTSPARELHRSFNPGLGDGPVYPILGPDGVLEFEHPLPTNHQWYGSEWSGEKVLWVSAPDYEGPILIRGRQLDGPHTVRFGDGLRPSDRMRLAVEPSPPAYNTGGWGNYPSYTRVRGPGCYGYQVDGPNFSDIIVFEAKPLSE